jgi:hypothetical protein
VIEHGLPLPKQMIQTDLVLKSTKATVGHMETARDRRMGQMRQEQKEIVCRHPAIQPPKPGRIERGLGGISVFA